VLWFLYTGPKDIRSEIGKNGERDREKQKKKRWLD
jgi:hypothetical protein